MTFTPGPWEKDGLKVIAINRGTICKCPVVTAGGVFNVEANARLIAAAPEMFEVCQFALKKLNRMTTDEFSKGGDKEIREKIDQVLAQVGE